MTGVVSSKYEVSGPLCAAVGRHQRSATVCVTHPADMNTLMQTTLLLAVTMAEQ